MPGWTRLSGVPPEPATSTITRLRTDTDPDQGQQDSRRSGTSRGRGRTARRRGRGRAVSEPGPWRPPHRSGRGTQAARAGSLPQDDDAQPGRVEPAAVGRLGPVAELAQQEHVRDHVVTFLHAAVPHGLEQVDHLVRRGDQPGDLRHTSRGSCSEVVTLAGEAEAATVA